MSPWILNVYMVGGNEKSENWVGGFGNGIFLEGEKTQIAWFVVSG